MQNRIHILKQMYRAFYMFIFKELDEKKNRNDLFVLLIMQTLAKSVNELEQQ